MAALTFAVLALVPFAAIAGTVSLARTRAGRRRGRGLAVASLVLAGAWTLTAAAIGVTVLPRPHPAARRPHPLRDTVFTLHTGDCADMAPNGIDHARAVDCGAAHDAEIDGTFLVAGRSWPGTAVLAQWARSGCASKLAGYLNPQLSPAGLTQTYVYPDRGAWNAGERTVVCEIRSANGTLTGSVRAAGH